jgi:hypothetical protein
VDGDLHGIEAGLNVRKPRTIIDLQKPLTARRGAEHSLRKDPKQRKRYLDDD